MNTTPNKRVHNRNPVWRRYSTVTATPVPVFDSGSGSGSDIQARFGVARAWIKEKGTPKLRKYLEYHDQVWEQRGTTCCAQTRRRKEMVWIAVCLGCSDLKSGVPEPISVAELEKAVDMPMAVAEAYAEAQRKTLNSGPNMA